jgi:hypothetical protein
VERQAQAQSVKLYAYAQLAMLAALALLGVVAWRYFGAKDAFEVARDLKEKTPLGLPARALDTGISSAVGREETFGGWLAEMFDPTTRAANKMLRSPVVLPQDRSAPDYSTPPYFGDMGGPSP